jgi:tetratricopeptide (TPR) repeat protein
LYDKLERWDDAHALYEQILAIGREILAPNDQAFGIWLANRAVHWERRGRYERAIECGEPARAILELHMGSSHPLLAKSVENLGWMQIGLSDFAAAEALFRRALDMREQLFGADSPEAARSRATLGNLFARSGHGDAEAEYGRALTILDAVLPPSHPDLVTILLELGDYYANGRSDANADRMYERAIRSHELAFGPHHPKLAAVLDRHASVLRRLGRNPEAKALDSRAIAIRRLEIPVKDEQARAVEPR